MDADGFAREVQVVRAELQWAHDLRRADAELTRAQFGAKGGRARPLLEALDSLTLEATRGYARRTYQPSNTTLRIEGDVAPAEVQGLIQATFPVALLRGEGRGCAHSPVPTTPDLPVTRDLIQIPAAVREPILYLGWELPTGFTPEDPKGHLLADWLEGHLRNTVAISPRVDEEDVSLGCVYDPGAITSRIRCSTPLPKRSDPAEVARRVRGGIAEKMGSWLRQGPGQAEYLIALKQNRFRWALADADRMEIADLERRARFSHFTENTLDPMPREAHLAFGVEAKDLREFGRQWVTPERMVAVALIPGGDLATSAAPLEAPERLVLPSATDWSGASPSFAGWSSEVRPNGLTLWYIPRDPGAPASGVAIVHRGGRSTGPVGAAEAFLRMRFDTRDLTVLSHAVATDYGSHVDWGAFAARAVGPRGNLDSQLYLVRSEVDETLLAGRPADDLNERRKDLLEDLEEYSVDFRNATVNERLYPDSHAAAPWWDRRIFAQRALDRRDVAAWEGTVVRPDGGVLVVVGNVELDRARELVGRFVDPWAPKPSVALPLPKLPGPPAARSVVAFEDQLVLAIVNVSCRLPARGPATDATLDGMEQLAYEGAWQVLRMGGSQYEFGASVGDVGPLGSTLSLWAILPPEAAGPALRAMLRVVDLLPGELTEDGLGWLRHTLHLNQAHRLSSSMAAFDTAVQAAKAGLTLDELTTYPERVDALDAGALTDLLAECHGHEVLSYIGPKVQLGLDGVEWRPWTEEARRLAEGREPPGP